MRKLTFVEAEYKVQLPEDWVLELKLGDMVVLEKTENGIFIRPGRVETWDEVFATKLPMGQPSVALDLSDVSGDDLLL